MTMGDHVLATAISRITMNSVCVCNSLDNDELRRSER